MVEESPRAEGPIDPPDVSILNTSEYDTATPGPVINIQTKMNKSHLELRE